MHIQSHFALPRVWKAPRFICFGRWNIVICFVLKLAPHLKRSICVMQSTGRRSVCFPVWGSPVYIEREDSLFVCVLWRTTNPCCIILMYQHKRALLWRWRLKWGRWSGRDFNKCLVQFRMAIVFECTFHRGERKTQTVPLSLTWPRLLQKKLTFNNIPTIVLRIDSSLNREVK